MQKRTLWSVGLMIVCLAVSAGIPSHAQSSTAKPTVYTYVSQWAVPRAQWPDMVKLEEADKPVLDKLVADGTLVGYGAYSNIIHQEGEPTHGSWFTATSEGKLLKALEALYAHPGLTDAPVQGASRHWDLMLTGDMYGYKPGTSTGGYLTWSTWQVKPGQMQAYVELTKKTIVPVLEKLLADGTILSYGELREDYHQGKLGVVYDYMTAADTASFDKANKAFEDLFGGNPALNDAFQAVTERDGHRDFLTHLSFMVSK